MNLSVTSPYNADFDGDEMNMHVPQGYETIAEIKEIMHVPKQIMNPQSNKPIMGIVQDSLLGCMLFTQRDTFINHEDFMNLLMWIDDVEAIPQPAILKPKPLWTGKQVFSLLIPKIQYMRYNEPRRAHNWASSTDKNILIVNGEILCGQMTKAQVGNTGGGLVHIIWKEQGSDACKAFLSQVQNVINNWLIVHGFTVGVQDIIARARTMTNIRSTLKKQLKKVQKVIQNSQIGKLKSQPGKTMIESFEAEVNQQLNDARDKSGNIALEDLSNANRLRNMVQAGSKGNNINIS
jgi:DNA-directed RNA polymerase II subunit RPB1